MKFTKAECATLWEALEDAIRDREAFAEAYTNRSGNVMRGNKMVIATTNRTIRKYRRLQEKLRARLAGNEWD